MTAVGIAVGLDLVFREPPTRFHPVVTVGKYLDIAARWVPVGPPLHAGVAGGAAWTVGASLALAAGAGYEAIARRLPRQLAALVRGAALWPLLSARMLLAEVAAVEVALAGDLDADLGAGRAAVARIVSRDTAGLTAGQVRAAALESLAENVSDSVVAPLFWYTVGGLPAAAAHRFANTADACWGYRTPRWLHAGRVAARADDLLNLVPARATAALLLLGARPSTWRAAAREARRTPSPNAGWPMAALAVRLDRRLGKPGEYELNAGGAEPGPADIPAALALTKRAIAAAVITALLLDEAKERACRR